MMDGGVVGLVGMMSIMILAAAATEAIAKRLRH